MLKDITLGQFFPGNSAVHNMDPRLKIVITLLYVTLIFTAKNFYAFAVYFLFVAATVFCSKIPFKFVFKGLKPLIFIIILTGLLNVFMTNGTVAFRVFNTPIKATWEGINLAAFMIIRLVLLIMGTSILTLTSSPISLTDGLEYLLNPLKKLKFPVHELSMMMTIAIRFIPTLLEETEKIMKAQKARGADFESGSLIKRAKALVPILAPLFISSFRRADELAMAMESRCYNGGEGRTKLKQLRMQKSDYTIAAICAAVLIFAAVIGQI